MRPGRNDDAEGALSPPEEARGGGATSSTFEGRVFVGFASAFAFAALLLGEDLVLLLGIVALAVVPAARWAVAANVRGVLVRRSVPSRARVGVPVRATYEIRREGHGTAIGLTVADRLGASAHPATLCLEVAALAAGSPRSHTETITFARRGRVTLAPPVVRTRWPLGIFTAWTQGPTGHEVLVRPREGRPTALLKDRLAGWLKAERRPSLRRTGDDVFHGVREYREGDDPRRIHWRTTARRGALTVAVWHREEGREVVVVLGRGAGVGPGSAETFERAVSIAATVLGLAARQALDTRVLLGRAGEVLRPGARPSRSAWLDALAVAKPQAGRRPRAALRRLAARPGRRIVVFVATGDEPGIARRLKAAAGRGGEGLLLRADGADVTRWVRGLP